MKIYNKFNSLLKFIFSIVFVFVIVLTKNNNFMLLIYYGFLILTLFCLSTVKILPLFKRLLVIGIFIFFLILALPFHHYENDRIIKFLFLQISQKGLLLSLNIIIKAIYSAMIMFLLSNTTDHEKLLIVLKKLGIPSYIITIIAMMLRYFSLFKREGENIIKARNARFVGKNSLKELRTFGHILGVLFLKTLDAGEKVYFSMISRVGNNYQTYEIEIITFKDVLLFILLISYVLGYKIIKGIL